MLGQFFCVTVTRVTMEEVVICLLFFSHIFTLFIQVKTVNSSLRKFQSYTTI